MKNIKTFTVALLLTLIVFTIEAQTDRGKILIGGSSSFSSMLGIYNSKDDDGKGDADYDLTISLAPQVGFFVIKGLAVGLQLNSEFYWDIADKSYDEATYMYTLDMISPFARYYFGSAKVKPYAQAAAGIGISTYKVNYKDEDIDDESSSSFIYGIQGKGGIGIFLKENVALDVGLSILWMSSKETKDNPDNYKELTTNIGLEVGFIFIL